MTQNYDLKDFPFKDDCLEIVEIAFNIHKMLGHGLSDRTYKSAFEIHLQSRGLEYLKEKQYAVDFNGMILEHKFYSDFVINGNIIVEIKSSPSILTESDLDVFSRLITTKPKIGLIINFNYELIQLKKIVLI